MFTIRLIERFVSYRRRRQTALELASLSEDQLKDIGVNRHDLFAPTRSR
jgi:uncharacterized protein YjiS (DUF1127 family)